MRPVGHGQRRVIYSNQPVVRAVNGQPVMRNVNGQPVRVVYQSAQGGQPVNRSGQPQIIQVQNSINGRPVIIRQMSNQQPQPVSHFLLY